MFAILLPVDGSEGSVGTAHALREFMQSFSEELPVTITLLYDPERFRVPGEVRWLSLDTAEHLLAEDEGAIPTILERITWTFDSMRYQVETMRESGPLVEGICRVAERGADDLVVVGITEHASEQLGDIVFVDVPDADITVSKDDEVVVIESVKAASDILAPLDGEIVEVNGALEDNPGLVNDDPTGDGWFFKLKIEDMSVLDDLMDEAAYKTFIG